MTTPTFTPNTKQDIAADREIRRNEAIAAAWMRQHPYAAERYVQFVIREQQASLTDKPLVELPDAYPDNTEAMDAMNEALRDERE